MTIALLLVILGITYGILFYSKRNVNEKYVCKSCGNKINPEQKFCPNCGTEVDKTDYEEIGNSTVEQMSEFKPLSLSPVTKKVAIAVSCIALISATAFGAVQYNQYQKNIEPLETSINFTKDENKNVLCKLTYDAKEHNTNLSMQHNGTIIEQWQKDALKDLNSSFSLQDTNKESSSNYKFKFDSIETNVGKPMILNFKVTNVTNSKEFAKFKEDFDDISLNRDMPSILSEFEANRIEGKKVWIAYKQEVEAQHEAERKRAEWQKQVQSNCVYRTSDGVCFTTQIFTAEPIKINDKWNGYDLWLSAKDACECKGYKLPNDNELRSLFKDILGVEINSGINIKTFKYSDTKVPTNYEVLKKIAPKGFYWNSLNNVPEWNDISLWEDSAFSDVQAYARRKYISWGDDETYQYLRNRIEYSTGVDTICVYDPDGRPRKSKVQEQMEQAIQAEKKKKEEIQKHKEQIDDALF